MKVTQYKCDKCGNVINGKRYTLMIVSVDHTDGIQPVKSFDMDCCFNCLPAFINEIPDGLPMRMIPTDLAASSENAFYLLPGGSEPEEDKKDPEPAKPSGGRKTLDFDLGKAISLRRGGWTLSKIADEMKCAPQTVANYLERAGVIKKKENADASNTADV